MTTLLNDYTKATFPLEVETAAGGRATLFGVFNNLVVGAVWWGENQETAWSVDGRVWDGRGRYKTTNPWTPSNLDLVPPPGLVGEEVALIRAEISRLEARISAHPAAPEEWMAPDRAKIKDLNDNLKRLEGGAC